MDVWSPSVEQRPVTSTMKRAGGQRASGGARGFRRGLPVGFVWSDDDGEIHLQPDEAVVSTVRETVKNLGGHLPVVGRGTSTGRNAREAGAGW